MSKNDLIKAIQEYRNYYTGLSAKINAVRADKSRMPEWKDEQIAKLLTGYNGKDLAYKQMIREAVEAVKGDLANRRQANIRKGLESAEAVNLIIGGIRSGSYSEQMMNDIIGAYADNPVVLESLRGELLKSNNEPMKIIGASIKQDHGDRITKNLDNIVVALDNIPSVDADGMSDWNAGLYQSGASFDGWLGYVSENID